MITMTSTASLDPAAANKKVASEKNKESAFSDETAKTRNTIADLVEASFASLHSKSARSVPASSSKSAKNKTDEESNKSKKDKKIQDSDSDEEDEDEAYATFTYLAIITALYLPFLLFLWIRRNVFGTASLVRSLFLGHMLRFGVAFMLLPPSTTKTFIPTRVWNFGLRTAQLAEKCWHDKRTQEMIPAWVHVLLSAALGVQTDPQGVVEKSKSSWPPPALMALGGFTVLVFVVHPDGLTWIVLDEIRKWIHTTVVQRADYVKGLMNGSIKMTASEISGTLASIIIFVTIVNGILSNIKHENPGRLREKGGKHKHRKGKKGRGRNNHGGASGNKGRIKSGHIKEVQDKLPSPPRRTRSMSDMETAIKTTFESSTDTVGVTSDTKKTTSTSPDEKKEDIISGSTQTPSDTKLDKENAMPKLEPISSNNEDDKSSTSSVATAQTNTTEGGRRKNRRKGRRGGHKNAASAPSTPKGRTKARTGNNATLLSIPAQNLQNPLAEKKSHRMYKQSQRNRSKKDSMSTAAASIPQRKQQPMVQNRRRSFTAPEVHSEKFENMGHIMESEKRPMEVSHTEPFPAERGHQACTNSVVCNSLFPANNRVKNQGIISPPSLRSQCDKEINVQIPQSLNSSYCKTSSYPNKSHSNNPAKMELSAFLCRVGLVGSSYEKLMADLCSVDALTLFTDSDYCRYGIGPGKRADILAFFESRKQRTENNQKAVGWNNAIVRPPPGLGVPLHDAAVGGTVRVVSPAMCNTNDPYQSVPYLTSASPSLSSNYSLTPGSSLNSFSLPLGDQLRERCSNMDSSRHIVLPPISPLQHNVPHHTAKSVSCISSLRPHNDEEIEADLQELGGQMAGSILDF